MCQIHQSNIRHENESLGRFLKMCKNGHNVSKHPDNQQNKVQNFLKSGNFLKILMPVKSKHSHDMPMKRKTLISSFING